MFFKYQWERIKNFLGLSLQLAKAEFKLRNEGSYLGVLWYLLNPILMFALLFFVFNDRLGQQIPNYPLYMMLGLIMFNFFQSSTIESVRSIIQEHNLLIKAINFPREALIASIVIKNLFSHFFEVVLFALIAIFLKANVLFVLYYLPILFLFLFFIFGTALVLSSLTVYFVDLDNIWNFAVRIIWLGTPIFYAIQGQTRLFVANLFNPMYYFITVARELIIYNSTPEIWIMAGTIALSTAALVFGLLIFAKLKRKFAELI